MAANIAKRSVSIAMAICLLVAASVLWLPAQLGAMATGFGLDARMLGLLGTVELAGFLAGSTFGGFVAPDRIRRWVLSGAALVVAANALLAVLSPALPFVVMRPLASLGAGVGFAYALKTCAAAANATRSFGVLMGLMSVMMMIGFQVTGRLLAVVDAATVARAVFGIYAVMGLLAALLALMSPPVATAGPESPVSHHAVPGVTSTVIVGLAAIGLSFVGQGSIFAFLQLMGAAHGFAVADVANAMSAWALLGIAGSFAASAIPARSSRSRAIGVALLLMSGGYVVLYAPPSLLAFTVGCALGGFYWNFLLPLQLGLLARADPSGRGSVWGGTTSSAGAMLGPVVAGFLVAGNDFRLAGLVSFALVLAGVACTHVIERAAAHSAGDNRETRPAA